MDIKLPQDPRGQRLVAIAALCLMAPIGYWYFLYKDKQAETVIMAAHADTVEELNAKTKADLAKRNESQLRADAERFGTELAVLRRLVPTENEVPALIDAISTAARRQGMDISSFEQDGTLPGDYFDAVKYKFTVTGPYHRIGELLAEIGSLPRIITPINLELLPTGPTSSERRPAKGEAYITAKFGVITYVAKTTPLPSVAAGGR